MAAAAAASEHIYDLLIVGAGPVGLLTAISAHRRGCRNIAVVDQARQFKPVGDYINVNPNGISALHILAPALAEQMRQQVKGGSSSFRFADVDGQTLKPDLPARNPAGEPNVGTTWYFIQSMLREALPGDIAVHLNSQCVALADEDHGTVRADFVVNRIRPNPFAHWNSDPAAEAARSPHAGNGSAAKEPEKVSLRAKLVIGADGINSCVRAEVYRRTYGEEGTELARALYSGFASFKSTGMVPPDLQDAADEVDKLYFPDGGFITLIGCKREQARSADALNLMLCHARGGVAERLGFEWKVIVHAAVPEALTTRDQRSQGFVKLCDAVEEQLRAAAFPDCVLRLARGMLRDPGNHERIIICRPLYIVPITTPPPYDVASTASRPPEGAQCFGHGRIFLAGDSLHGMPPFISQGTSMGWEDVVELVDLLALACGWAEGEHNVPDDAVLDELRVKYAEARTERVACAQAETLRRQWAYDENGFATQQRWIHKFLPRAQGWQTEE